MLILTIIIAPKVAPGAKFRCSIDMGTFDGGTQALNKALDEVRHNGGFGSNGYNLIRKNCNHFCEALLWQLLRRRPPAYINRLANVGDCCSCLLPKDLLADSPVGGSSGNNQSSFQAPSNGFMSRGSGGGNSSVTAFSGKGNSLGGSSTSSSSGAPSDLTDRRERARKAALARMERSKNSE